MDYPKLRPLEVFLVETNQICMRDPEGFSDKILLLQPAAFFICSLFDGKHSFIDIQSEFAKQFGAILFTEQIKEIEGNLESAYFLENESFAALKEKTIADFKEAKTRPAIHAGRSYPDDPQALLTMLSGLFAKAKETSGSEKNPESGRLRGLIAPHIDIARGGECYAAGYSELFRSTASTYVILGIAHNASMSPFIFTKKEFATPFGNLECDLDFIENVASHCKSDLFKDEFLHKNEHSVEFQALFLSYLARERTKLPRIVPVLCATVPRVALSEKSPYEDESVRELVDALSVALKAREEDVCVIAGVDLSHVGKRFGRDILMSENYLGDLESADKRMIRYILDCDAEGFMRNIMSDKDSRNVCGTPAIYTMLKALKPCTTSLLHYGQSVERAMGSAVTFASVAFYE